MESNWYTECTGWGQTAGNKLEIAPKCSIPKTNKVDQFRLHYNTSIQPGIT